MLFPVQKPLSPIYVTPCRRHLVTGPDSFTSDNTVIKHSGPALPKLRSDPNTFLPMSSLTLHMTVLLWCILSRKNDNSSHFLKISGSRQSLPGLVWWVFTKHRLRRKGEVSNAQLPITLFKFEIYVRVLIHFFSLFSFSTGFW